MRYLLILLIPSFLTWSHVVAPSAAEDEESVLSSGTFSGLKLRELGLALTSGRIADFAVDPENPKRYFVAVCSGNVWRTVNAGTTYEPIFDDQDSYSIGCITMDPNDPNVLWVGTGENNSQRSVAYGDGLYKSKDGGDSWEKVGLESSEHIGMIAVDPRDSDVVYVAAQGPLWSAGGDRGLYKTTDGGGSWEKVLDISENTGVSEVHFDPRDPDVLYAVAYQRRRHVWVLLNGGPESGIYKSTDAGASWVELEKGLPSVDKGRIGMDVSPVNPDVLYAVVEAQDDEGGFFRSTDAGATWEKRSDYNASSPQYYHEIFCDLENVDRVYSVDTFFQVTEDGGESFERLPINQKHVDDHAVWIDPDDTDHLLVGCDGGVYETWDRCATWNFKANLPLTQFYKITVDDDFPFYSVYGGTQDNNTLGTRVRTTSASGIHNTDWIITLGGDGFEPQVDPTNPDIVYSQYQYGGLARYDRASGEALDIQPQADSGEALKWNWSAGFIISPHSNTRLYYGANILFRSDDRGDSWRRVSGDLTRQVDRNQLEVMDRIWSVDAVSKNRSTSYYGNIVALTESPRVEGLLYVGTDDGLIQVSEDGGRSWRREDGFRGVPDRSYVSSLVASQHDADVIYATFDNHKKGDFKPYVLRSDNRGRSWKAIAGDLPERGTVYSLAEDHLESDLLFVGTEFGVFFTLDGGDRWVQLKGGFPTIACRDIDIQRRESDLAVGTFGRGIWVLDDYSPLRLIGEEMLANDDTLFPVKDAWLYVEKTPLGGRGKASLGDSFYVADNPPFGAVFTYYLHEAPKTLHDQRREAEKKVQKEGGDNPYPSWDELRSEDREKDPAVVLTVRDADGDVVRRVVGPTGKGFQRVAWNLRLPAPDPASTTPFHSPAPWITEPVGPLVTPGRYTVTAALQVRGVTTPLGEAQTFEVKPLGRATLPARDPLAALAFQKETWELRRAVAGAVRVVSETQDRLDHIHVALRDTPGADRGLFDLAAQMEVRLDEIRDRLSGDDTIAGRSEPTPPSINGRVSRITWGWDTTSAPTTTHRESYAVAVKEFDEVLANLRRLNGDLQGLERRMEQLGAPWTPGRLPVLRDGE